MVRSPSGLNTTRRPSRSKLKVSTNAGRHMLRTRKGKKSRHGSRRNCNLRPSLTQLAAGRYPESLRELSAILQSETAASERGRIALLTGENWHITFVANNARAPQWSPNGRLVAYETGTGAARVTRVAQLADSVRVVAELAGGLATFSADGTHLLRFEGSTTSGELKWRNLVGGSERTDNDGGLQKAQLILNATGDAVIAVAALPDSTRTDLWQISLASGAGAPKRLTSSDSLRTEVQPMQGTSLFLHAVGGRTPITIGTGNNLARSTRTRFAVIDAATGVEFFLTANHRPSPRMEKQSRSSREAVSAIHCR